MTFRAKSGCLVGFTGFTKNNLTDFGSFKGHKFYFVIQYLNLKNWKADFITTVKTVTTTKWRVRISSKAGYFCHWFRVELNPAVYKATWYEENRFSRFWTKNIISFKPGHYWGKWLYGTLKRNCWIVDSNLQKYELASQGLRWFLQLHLDKNSTQFIFDTPMISAVARLPLVSCLEF